MGSIEPPITPVENHVQVRRFARALGVAVYDRQVEKDRPVEFYFDADVLVNLIAGLSQVEPGRRPSPRLLVRALLSSGYLGKLHVLRPHALEFDRQIRILPTFAAAGQQQLFRAAVEEAMRQFDLHKHDEAIAKIAATTEPEAVRVGRLLTFLQDDGYETFVGMELAAGGTWKHRLDRLWKSGYVRFRQQEFDLHAMLAHEETRVFMKALSGYRQGAGWSINNLTDVLALRSLAESIRRNPEKQVRFYTDTEVLRQVIQEDTDVLSALSYGNPTPETTIIRDDDYFLIRASFAALAFSDTATVTPSRDGEFEELQNVSRELNQVLSTHFRNIDAYIATTALGGRKLAEVIAEFETLSFVNRVWLTYRVPEPMRQFLPGIVALYTNQSLLAATSQEIENTVLSLRREVKDYVQDFQGWARSFETIYHAAIHKRRIRAATDPLPDPWRDLGLGRWGIETEVSHPADITDEIHAFLSDSETDLHLRCASFAFRLASRDADVAELERSYIVLWFLEQFELLRREFQQGREHLHPHHNAGLFILDSVAQMRTTQRGNLRAKQRIIDNLGKLIRILANDKRGFGRMGLGYVCYWAWRDEVDGPGLYRLSDEEPLPPGVRAWAIESYAHANRAVRDLEPGTLARAFAVNHCAYLGSVAGLDRERTVEHVLSLGGIRRNSDQWHYRFEDTVAVHFTFQAIYSVREYGLRFLKSEDGEPERRRLCGLLTDAKGFLARAAPFFEDPEVLEHRQQVATLHASLGCE